MAEKTYTVDRITAITVGSGLKSRVTLHVRVFKGGEDSSTKMIDLCIADVVSWGRPSFSQLPLRARGRYRK